MFPLHFSTKKCVSSNVQLALAGIKGLEMDVEQCTSYSLQSASVERGALSQQNMKLHLERVQDRKFDLHL